MVCSLRSQLSVLAVEVQDACEVRRVAHVHGVGQRLYGGTRLVLARLQVFIEDVVGIVGSNESLDGQSHLVSEQCRADVAEVSAGYTHHQLVCQSQCFHAGIGIEVVESLRQKTCHVDAVGRCELHVLVQFLVHECRLDQRLTVVKDAVYLDGCDILAQRGELTLLDGADLALRIEHIDVDTLHAQESVGNSTSRVTAGSHQHVDKVTSRTRKTCKIAQQAGHEACADILEGQRGSVEQLQRINLVSHLDYRAIKRQRVIHQVLQGITVHVVAEEVAGHVVGNILELHVLDVVKERLWQFVYFLWHVESSVFCQSFYYRLFQVGYGRLPIGAVILHSVILFSSVHS